MAVIESAGITDTGKKRDHNEDAYYVDDDLGLYVVADGMGGHQAGEVASGLVIDTMRDYMKRFETGEEVEELTDSDDSLSREANRLLSGIILSNRVVHELSQTNEGYRGMGSTVSSLYFTNDTVIVGNVGDSPIYLIHEGSIERLSTLHTVMEEQRLLDPDGEMRLGENFRHMLTRAMGAEDSVLPDVIEIPFFQGDILTISSDGLTDLVTPEEIMDVVVNDRPERSCQKLVDLANERGGVDNITVIVVKVKGRKGAGAGLRAFFFHKLKSLFGAPLKK